MDFQNPNEYVKIHIQMEIQLSKRFDAAKPMQVGGQAVLEGVMMRAPGMVATAVRRTNGEIVVKREVEKSLGVRYPFLKLPIIRGALGLVEMMIIGMRTLNFSAEVAMRDVDRRNGDGANGTEQNEPASERRENFKLALTVALSLAVGIAIFFVTPLFVATAFFSVGQEPLTFNLVAGAIRIALLLVYLGAFSMMKATMRWPAARAWLS